MIYELNIQFHTYLSFLFWDDMITLSIGLGDLNSICSSISIFYFLFPFLIHLLLYLFNVYFTFTFIFCLIFLLYLSPIILIYMSKLVTFWTCILRCIILPLICSIRLCLRSAFILSMPILLTIIEISFKYRCSRCIPHSWPTLMYLMSLFLVVKIVTNKLRFRVLHTIFSLIDICSMTSSSIVIASWFEF